MSETSAQCSTTGSPCRLLLLDQPGPRPVWAVLDAVRERRFTGEVTLHLSPHVRVYVTSGRIHLVERETDPSVEQRLLTQQLITPDELERGVVGVAGIRHLGRLFDRVPGLDRDAIELSIDLHAEQAVSEIADLIVDHITVTSYRFHPSGLHHWWTDARAVEVEPAAITAAEITAAEITAAEITAAEVTAAEVTAAEVQASDVDLYDALEDIPGKRITWLPDNDDDDNDDDDVSDEVKSAVRLALAEIEAATRPLIAASFSMSALYAAESASNTTKAVQNPSLPERHSLKTTGAIALLEPLVADSANHVASSTSAGDSPSGVGLRRLIGGIRKG